ncbi:MAG: ATP-binding protein [Acidimicrobiales bacterium]
MRTVIVSDPSIHLGPDIHHTSRTFEAEPQSAAYVRNYVRESLQRCRVRSDEAILLANELATNAIVHTHKDFVVELSVNDSTCRIGVLDHDTGNPKLTNAKPSDSNGRGLALVKALSNSWGVERRDDGKAVWCDIAVSHVS